MAHTATGQGGNDADHSGAGGAGGIGVNSVDSGLLYNLGSITGGSAGNGGAGVYLNGGTLVTSGSISGGTGGTGKANVAFLHTGGLDCTRGQSDLADRQLRAACIGSNDERHGDGKGRSGEVEG
jgi:hypothetical protein